MKIHSTKGSYKSKKTIVAISVIFILSLIFIILEVTNVTSFFHASVVKTPEQIKESETNSNDKQKFIDNTSTDSTNNFQEHSSSDIDLTIRQESDNSVTILTQLKNYSDGTCDLTITNNNDTITRSAPVLYQDTFSTCAGFSIPANEMANGTWNITLSVTSKGETSAKTISAEVK